ncbi:MAG: FliA/WhiG family RNA polymerase sigma factor [Desulfobaccales bacterium]
MDERSLVRNESVPGPGAGPGNPDLARQHQMVLQYAPLIRYIAARLALRLPSHISQEDLISSGIIGLIDAIQKYDLGKHINFGTYAEYRIKGAMLDELRNLDWIPRSVRQKAHLLEKAYARLQKNLGRPAEAEEVAALLKLDLEDLYHLLDVTRSVCLVPLDSHPPRRLAGFPGRGKEPAEFLQDENLRDALQAAHLSQLGQIVVKALEVLPDKEKLLINLYYYEELTMKEIGQIMNLTESRISQLHSQAMSRLRHRLREYARELEN